jgi:hypothetical protein
VPTGDSVLQRGDVVTAFGTLASKERMIERLNAGADEPTAEMWLEDIEAQGGDGGLDPGADEGP